MGAYTNMQNFIQIEQHLKNFIFKGQLHNLLKMCNFGTILHGFLNKTLRKMEHKLSWIFFLLSNLGVLLHVSVSTSLPLRKKVSTIQAHKWMRKSQNVPTAS